MVTGHDPERGEPAMLTICSYCQEIIRPRAEDDAPGTSHGMCPKCYADFMFEIFIGELENRVSRMFDEQVERLAESYRTIRGNVLETYWGLELLELHELEHCPLALRLQRCVAVCRLELEARTVQTTATVQ